MDLIGILIAAVIVGGTGLFIALFLGIAGTKLAVEVDEREEAIGAVLPGNNCGGCGYAGCAGLASAIVAGNAELTACPVGGSDVADKIAAIMGQVASEAVPMTAFVRCGGSCERTSQDYNYFGIEDCIIASHIQNGGSKTCNYSCYGFGTCVKACPFDAIHIVDGVAVVDKEACKACGKCLAVCPHHIIDLVPKAQKQLVLCSNKDIGRDAMKACTNGCIGCKMCEKVCEFDAIKVEGNIAYIDPAKCTNCGKCAEKCPRKCIITM